MKFIMKEKSSLNLFELNLITNMFHTLLLINLR